MSPTDLVGDWVGKRVTALQRGYLADEAGPVRQLAVLRRTRAGSVGDPEVWAALDGLPDELTGHGDEVGRFERAAYDAVVLYAVHQQSHRVQGMHRSGVRLGQALARLRWAGGSDAAVERRFKQLGTAGTYDAALWHLRSLVTQLRAADIALDHGLLARDLARLQTSAGRDQVRLRWGRDFYRPRPADTDPTTSTALTADLATAEGDPS